MAMCHLLDEQVQKRRELPLSKQITIKSKLIKIIVVHCNVSWLKLVPEAKPKFWKSHKYKQCLEAKKLTSSVLDFVKGKLDSH